MSRSNTKKPYRSIDHGRKAYYHDEYSSMVNTTPNKGVYDQVLERHSIFEKPYLDGTDSYLDMQEFHRSNYRAPYLDLSFNSDPLGDADPCAGGGTVHATLDGVESPYHYVECGTIHAVGMSGGIGDIGTVGIAGVLNGGVSGNMYSAPNCEGGGCLGDETDHILVSDACGRTSNLIIITEFPDVGTLGSIEGSTEPGADECYIVEGGVLPLTWSIDGGASVDEFGCVAFGGACDPLTLTVEDACGDFSSKTVYPPDGAWVSIAIIEGPYDTPATCCGSTSVCYSGPYICYISTGSGTRNRYHYWAIKEADFCADLYCDECVTTGNCSGSTTSPLCTPSVGFAVGCWVLRHVVSQEWQCP